MWRLEQRCGDLKPGTRSFSLGICVVAGFQGCVSSSSSWVIIREPDCKWSSWDPTGVHMRWLHCQQRIGLWCHLISPRFVSLISLLRGCIVAQCVKLPLETSYIRAPAPSLPTFGESSNQYKPLCFSLCHSPFQINTISKWYSCFYSHGKKLIQWIRHLEFLQMKRNCNSVNSMVVFCS